jgi:predicted extracellular nuclease
MKNAAASRRFLRPGLVAAAVLAAVTARGDTTPQGLPFAQNWTNTGLITVNDNWSGVPGIIGYRGDDLTTATGTDPQTLLVDGTLTPVNVVANQAVTTNTAGGIQEIEIANPTIAFQGSGTADAPFVLVTLNTTGFNAITVAYNLRDLDGSADNAIQQVALHFRVGTSGSFTNVPTGFVADATTGPSQATLVTPVSAILPASADNQPVVQVRVMTTNAVGNDELVGVDDIQVTGTTGGGQPNLSVGDASVAEGNAGATTATFTVSLNAPAGAGGVTFDVATADGTATTAGGDYLALSLTGQSIPQGSSSATFGVTVNGDTAVEPNETFFFNVTNVTGAVVVDGQGTGTITNDDFTITPIHDIQGPGSSSPFAGTFVTTTGVVTGLKTNGFFIQGPDAEADADPNSSEGVFVFTSAAPPAAAAIGNLVRVGGTVSEFIPSADPNSPPLTELTFATTTLLSTGNALPAAIPLTAADTPTTGTLEQLERFEGMRVSVASLTVVAPTDGNVSEPNATSTTTGLFQGVITGIARPFREPGIEAPDTIPNPPCCIPRFDANPERLRVDSDAQPGAVALEVTTGAVVTGLVGPLDYGFFTYTILPDAATPPGVSGIGSAVPAPAPMFDEFTVASFNLERFFDTVNDPGIGEPVLTPTAFANRLNKSSLAIRNVLQSPDILGLSEIENLSTLQSLASKVNADTVAGGAPDPQYTAHLVEGNDIGGIDVGFLVKSSRVSVGSVTQFGATATYINPETGQPELLNDRPPLVLEAAIAAPLGPSVDVTVIVNHLRSLSGVDDPADGARVRAKRKAQAEYLANLIQARQTADPLERIVSVGDYNAFNVNDGYVDSIATIKGMPTPPENVLSASPDLVNPDLLNAIDLLPAAQKYSYVFGGNAQTLDHVLLNQQAAGLLSRFHYARLDADFPEAFRNNPNRPERISDHDAALAYFGFSTPVVSISNVSVTEPDSGTTTASFTVSLDRPSAQTVSGTFATQNGSATSPADYQGTSGPVTFAPGDTSETVNVTVNGDLLDESDETFFVNLTGFGGSPVQGQGTILDNDPLPLLTVSDVSVVEGDAGTVNAVFTVSLTPASGRSALVVFATANGTATAPGDYTAQNGVVSFAAGETSQQVPVAVNGDALDELPEAFNLNLTSPQNAVLADDHGLANIADDEIGGADFNADGRTDILWRQQVSGENVAWLMDGTTLNTGTFTTPGTFSDTGWKIAGANDFNQDEQGDIFWQHAGSGELVVWFMNGTVLTSGTFTNPPALSDPRWKVYATGDFNGDGKPDLVWRHQDSGQIVMWFMDGVNLGSGTLTNPSTLADLGWQIAASGDFNRDGKADIVWRHGGSGEIAVWYMNGATLLSGTLTTPSALSDTQWRIVGSGDFNLDTKPDILWRHSRSGQIVVWFMDNATLLSGTFTNPPALSDTNWQIVGPR